MHKGQRLPGVRPQWEPIITRDVWNNYERVRQGRKKKGAPSAGKPKHLLSGFAVCGKCGDRLYAHKVARPVRKDGTRAHPYRVYDCMKNRCVSIQADRLDEVAEKIVIARLQSAEVLQAIHTPQDVKPIVNELDDLNSRRSAIVGLLSDGLIDMENARADLERLAAKHGRLERKLESLREHSPLTDIALAHSIPDRWKALPIMTRRSIIDTLGLRITVNPGQRGYVALARDGSRTIDLRRLVITWVS